MCKDKTSDVTQVVKDYQFFPVWVRCPKCVLSGLICPSAFPYIFF